MKMMKRKKRMPTTEQMPPHPLSPHHHLLPLAAAPEEINEEGPMEVIPEQEALMPHDVIPADAEPEMPHLCLYHALMIDYEDNLLRLEDDFDDLDDDLIEDHSDIDEYVIPRF
jgi:hypothetical protein